MNTQKAINPAQVSERRVQKQKLDKNKFSISSDFSANPPKNQGNYQKLVKLISVGDTQSTTEFLEEFGLYEVLGEFFSVNAEYDAKLEIAANFAPIGGCDA